MGEVLQTSVALIVIIVGGWWWWQKRENKPRANIDFSTEHVRISDTQHLIRITITLENVGNLRLHIRRGTVIIQQVSPLASTDDSDGPFNFCRTGSDKNGNEFLWPGLHYRNDIPFECDFEPKESGTIIYEVVLTSIPQTASIRVCVENEAEKGLLWNICKLCHFE
jgi:hypothetical protein